MRTAIVRAQDNSQRVSYARVLLMLRVPQASENAPKKRAKEPLYGSARWEERQRNSRVAENGRARRNDPVALNEAGQLHAAYGTWRERSDGSTSLMNAVAKRIRWEERSGWTGRYCGVDVPVSVTFGGLASEFGINARQIQRSCDKALARNEYAPGSAKNPDGDI